MNFFEFFFGVCVFLKGLGFWVLGISLGGNFLSRFKRPSRMSLRSSRARLWIPTRPWPSVRPFRAVCWRARWRTFSSWTWRRCRWALKRWVGWWPSSLTATPPFLPRNLKSSPRPPMARPRWRSRSTRVNVKWRRETKFSDNSSWYVSLIVRKIVACFCSAFEFYCRVYMSGVNNRLIDWLVKRLFLWLQPLIDWLTDFSLGHSIDWLIFSSNFECLIDWFLVWM